MRRAIVMAMMLATSSAAQVRANEVGACARLAPSLKMKQGAGSGSGSDAVAEWQTDLLGGIGKALFGGSAASTMSVEPLPDADVVDYAPYSRACTRKGVNVDCHIVGPARLLVATDKTEASVDLTAGEKVESGIKKGRHIYCRDLR